MKVIDLLNKIANGEEVPYRIRYLGEIYEYVEEMKWYLRDDMKCELSNSKKCLNDEVEILAEPKGIPLKINKIIPSQNYVISDSKNNSVDERLEIIRKRLYANELYMLDIANTLNEIIDYLKSKGE